MKKSIYNLRFVKSTLKSIVKDKKKSVAMQEKYCTVAKGISNVYFYIKVLIKFFLTLFWILLCNSEKIKWRNAIWFLSPQRNDNRQYATCTCVENNMIPSKYVKCVLANH